MTYIERKRDDDLWWDLYYSDPDEPIFLTDCVVFRDTGLAALLEPTVKKQTRLSVDKFRYALAADYIEENWDRLLRIAETAAGVDPEPLLRRLLERLRTEWADWQNGVGKC